ncbi:MAG: Gfo/Idh/MocA family oxidoreductase [Deltaproteobacteria bacterium]|jgi:UDP-2-acetamido-3-amino-2,3-dideoxy-glucuronate N-acetyltransferase|nr:Gfo/Idh/MocA family oxidoreductase [Deltaproteobacteria bacterium]
MTELIHRPRVAVIGTGYWGRNLVRNFYQLGALKTVSDSNQEILKSICQQYPGLEGAPSLEEVLKDPGIRGIVLATPPRLHAEQTIMALSAGKDVLVEKPLALNLDDGRQMVRLAEQKQAILMVDHILNRHPAVIRLKEIINTGELGRICHVYSRRLNFGRIRREGKALWDLAPHDISLIMNLLGTLPVSVQAFGGSYLTPGTQDVADADLVFPMGIKAHISVSWLNPFKEQRLVLVGLDKMAVFEDTAPWDGKLTLYSYRLRWRGLEPEVEKAEPEKIALAEKEPLKEQCLAFLAAIETRIPPTDSSGHEGLQVLAVLTAMDRSLEESRAQLMKFDDPVGDFLTRKIEAGSGYTAHPTAIIDSDAVVGPGTRIWHFSHILQGSLVGPECNIGQNVVIGPRVRIGKGCKIQNNVSVYEGVELEDDVFCGPSMVFTNVFNPRAFIRRMSEMRPTLVKRGASIGANATVVCGHTLGEYCFIGAGAVVASDVPPHALMVGVPARRTGWVCRCGEKLGETLACPICGLAYRETGSGLEVLTEKAV